MAAILRSRNFIKILFSASRSFDLGSFVVRVPSSYECPLGKGFRFQPLQRHLVTQGAQQPAVAEYDPISMQGRIHSLDKALYKLDLDVRRIGRINLKEVEDIFNEIKNIGSATSTQSLLLIRCCGSLLPEETPAARSDLVNKVWKMLEELGTPVDVSHYNALLKVYLENEFKFSATDFLAQMEAKGIQPNRVTYQRMISKYCQEADIEGASKILELMKSKELPINENVFNSLIMGHAKANDMKNALNIIEVMRTAQVEPSADTYTHLLCGYAEKGDIEGIRQAQQELEKNEVLLADKDYLEVVYALAVNGHPEYVDEILSKMRKLVGYNQDCITAILRLVNAGQDEVANQLLLSMPQGTMQDGSPVPVGQFFIRHLVRAGRPVEKILNFCKALKSQGLNQMGLSKATESALYFKRTDHAIAFIKEMHSEGYAVRPHYFWPILLQHGRKKDEAAIYSTLQTMMDLGCPANYETYVDYALPGLNLQDLDAVIQKTSDFGHSVGAVINPLVQYLLLRNDIRQTNSLVNKYPVRLNPTVLSRSLASACKETGDIPNTLELLQYLKENPEHVSSMASQSDWCGRFLLDYLVVSGQTEEGLEPLLSGMKNKGLLISNSTADIIHSRLKGNISEAVSVLLEEISTSNLESVGADEEGYSIPHPRGMDIDELESHLIELKNKGMNTRGVLRRLLMAHCRFKNLDRAVTLKEELEKEGYPFSPAMYAQIMELHVSHGQLGDALKCLEDIRQCDPGFPVDDHKILNLATLLVKNDKADDAFALLDEHYKKYGIRDKQSNIERNVLRLLTAAADKGNAELTNQLFQKVVVDYKYALPTNLVVGPLVKVHLVRNDFPSALREYETCCKTYRQSPWKNELFHHLITVEDSDNLQKVMDLCTEIHGEMNTLYDLACAFIETGRTRQARKIFETPGLRAKHLRLEAICNRYIQMNMTEELETLVNITRDLFDIDRDSMYFSLLKAYAKNNDIDKALGVWTSLQEENIQPSDRTLQFLAEVLQKNGKPVPFIVPVSDSDRLKEAVSIKEMLQKEDLESALEEKRRLEEAGKKLDVTTASGIIELLVRKDRVNEALHMTQELLSRNLYPAIKILKFLVNRLARMGDFETLLSLQRDIPLTVQRYVSFVNLIANAYLNSGQASEYLNNMEQDLVMSKNNFPFGGMLGILEKQPDLENRVIDLAKRFATEEQFYAPQNALWMHYFYTEQYDKADAVMQEYPQVKERPRFNNIIVKAMQSSNVTMAQKLVEVLKGCTLSPQVLATAVGGLMDLLVNLQRPDDAVSVLQNAENTMQLNVTDFSITTLARLQHALTERGREVPFTVPHQVKKHEDLSSSSSSDDERP